MAQAEVPRRAWPRGRPARWPAGWGSSPARPRPTSSRRTRSASSSSTCTAASASSRAGTPSRAPTPAARSARSRPRCRASGSRELLPHTARQMHHLCLVRGVNTSEDDHGKGAYLMMHRPAADPGRRLPAPRRRLRQGDGPRGQPPCPATSSSRPGGGGGRGSDAAYLGRGTPASASATASRRSTPTRPGQVSEPMDAARHDFRRRVNERFLSRRRTAVTEAYTYSYEQALRAHEAARRLRRRQGAGPRPRPLRHHDFGRHCLLARRLLENGATFVQVSHSNYDTHNENFNFHIEQLGEFDRPLRRVRRRPGTTGGCSTAP